MKRSRPSKEAETKKPEKSERRRPGAQPGNVNASKNPFRVSLRRLLNGEALPPQHERVQGLARLEADRIARDLGGRESMSGAKLALLRVWQTAHMATLLILWEMIENGVVVRADDGNWDLSNGMQRLSAFLGQERLALVSLGLDKIEKPLDIEALFGQEDEDAA